MLQYEEEVCMATLRATPTRHCHTEQFSGILTDQYLPGLSLKREGGMGKTKAQNDTQTTSYCINNLQRTASKQLCIQVTRCCCQRHWATPSMAGKTADQHCFKVNFASITFSHIMPRGKGWVFKQMLALWISDYFVPQTDWMQILGLGFKRACKH